MLNRSKDFDFHRKWTAVLFGETKEIHTSVFIRTTECNHLTGSIGEVLYFNTLLARRHASLNLPPTTTTTHCPSVTFSHFHSFYTSHSHRPLLLHCVHRSLFLRRHQAPRRPWRVIDFLPGTGNSGGPRQAGGDPFPWGIQ